MKTRKWIWWTLAVIFTLAAFTVIGFAGFRIGYVQGLKANPNASNFMARPVWRGQGQAQNFDKNFEQRNPVHAQRFGEKQNDRFGGRGHFGSPLAGLGTIIILGLLVWLGYKYVKNSGWRLTRTVESEPVVVETPAPKKAKK